MPFAAISDVHSNLEALEAVLSEARRAGAARIFFLGDAVGYGPDPNECVGRLVENCEVLLAGNHDRAAIGIEDVGRFNPYARAAVLWTMGVLTEKSREAIAGFAMSKAIAEMGLLLVHSSPVEPEQWRYLTSPEEAARAFGGFAERICMVGHSHVPFIAELTGREMRFLGEEAEFKEGSRYLINVGSVGQPRDGDPRACYAVFDEHGVSLRKTEYPVGATQEKMRLAGLPRPLIDRLALGV